MRAAMIAVLAAAAGLLGAAASGEVLHFRAVLTPVADSPSRTTRGAGRAVLSLDTESRTLDWRITYGGLSGPVTGARVMSPPQPGGDADAATDFAPPLTSPIAASTQLNDIEIGDLRAGLWSVRLLTARHPQGEIAGSLERTP